MVEKPTVSIDRLVTWYVGNYLLSPSNALREDDDLMDAARVEVEKLRGELQGKEMTHKDFLNLVTQRGLHSKYYLYEKPKRENCAICHGTGAYRYKLL